MRNYFGAFVDRHLFRFSIMTTKRKSSIRKRSQRARTRSTSKVYVTSAGKKTKTPRYVYYFGDGHADGAGSMKPLLGGKGANLHEMTRIGLPVPSGFTITTEVCTYFYANKRKYPRELQSTVAAALHGIEKDMRMKFGDPHNPLLVSVRSGARASMPGMMDTILNLGLNDATAEALARRTKNTRFAFDAYRRFVQMYGDVVLGLKPQHKDEIDPFEHIIEQVK